MVDTVNSHELSTPVPVSSSSVTVTLDEDTVTALVIYSTITMYKGTVRPEYTHSKGSILVERGPYSAVPKDNYPSGTGKSHIWMGAGYYVPSSRGWIPIHDYRSLPTDTRRDAIYMESEDQWVDFMRNRDTPSGYYHKNVGIYPSGVPELRLDGYTRDLPNMPGMEVLEGNYPKEDARLPGNRHPRGGYYGYYHEALQAANQRLDASRPFYEKITANSVPKL